MKKFQTQICYSAAGADIVIDPRTTLCRANKWIHDAVFNRCLI